MRFGLVRGRMNPAPLGVTVHPVSKGTMIPPSSTPNRALFVAPADDMNISAEQMSLSVPGAAERHRIADTSAAYETLVTEGLPIIRCTRCGAWAITAEDGGLPVMMHHYNPCGKDAR